VARKIEDFLPAIYVWLAVYRDPALASTIAIARLGAAMRLRPSEFQLALGDLLAVKTKLRADLDASIEKANDASPSPPSRKGKGRPHGRHVVIAMLAGCRFGFDPQPFATSDTTLDAGDLCAAERVDLGPWGRRPRFRASTRRCRTTTRYCGSMAWS